MSLVGSKSATSAASSATDLEFDGRCNLISGANASGKTSLLEAIFFLGRGRSFRTARNETLIRKGADELLLTGRFEAGESIRPVGVRYSREGFEARAAGNRIGSLAELATILPVQAIDPEVHRLVEEGPQERRRYLDWGVFHVEPRFVEQWRRYQRALKQRNAALRAEAPGTGRPCLGSGAAGVRARAWRCPDATTSRNCSHTSPRSVSDSWARPIELSLSDGWAAGTDLQDAIEHVVAQGPGAGHDPRRAASRRPVDPRRRRPGQAPGVARSAETDCRGDAAGAAEVRCRAGQSDGSATCG